MQSVSVVYAAGPSLGHASIGWIGKACIDTIAERNHLSAQIYGSLEQARAVSWQQPC